MAHITIPRCLLMFDFGHPNSSKHLVIHSTLLVAAKYDKNGANFRFKMILNSPF